MQSLYAGGGAPKLCPKKPGVPHPSFPYPPPPWSGWQRGGRGVGGEGLGNEWEGAGWATAGATVNAVLVYLFLLPSFNAPPPLSILFLYLIPPPFDIAHPTLLGVGSRR
uniref:Uncharacterized protein n=1 Tax=Morchella importuna TaxID=1174673 RepID=A0A650AF70_9PEZI|nr:hypothetical protein [Morchella importuna]QGN66675.1 hypothetical protein [Morchella importuna]